jgi:hypothetical protein
LVIGYVAFLDVLGFSRLIAGDSQHRIDEYLAGLETTFRTTSNARALQYVVFSDSIIITTKTDEESDFVAIIRVCSRLFGALLENGIAIRGAIAHGQYQTSQTSFGTFVAGRAIIDAYHYENQQDWVGIMLAPSVREKIPDLAEHCKIRMNGTERDYNDLLARMRWAAFLQECPIPFHTSMPSEPRQFHGFAVVPTHGTTDVADVMRSVQECRESLQRLRSIAPTPEAQKKYENTSQWLLDVCSRWFGVLGWYDQLVAQQK